LPPTLVKLLHDTLRELHFASLSLVSKCLQGATSSDPFPLRVHEMDLCFTVNKKLVMKPAKSFVLCFCYRP